MIQVERQLACPVAGQLMTAHLWQLPQILQHIGSTQLNQAPLEKLRPARAVTSDQELPGIEFFGQLAGLKKKVHGAVSRDSNKRRVSIAL